MMRWSDHDRVLEGPILLGILQRFDNGSAVNPCLRALCRDRCFPSSVFGPVLLSALSRFASIWRRDVMGGSTRLRRPVQLRPYLQRFLSASRRLGAATLAKRSGLVTRLP